MCFLERLKVDAHRPLVVVTSCSAIGGVTVLLTALTEENVAMGPTFLLISTALACEYNKSVAVSPESLLQGLSTRFPVYTGGEIPRWCAYLAYDHLASVKEVCVLAMLKLSDECEEVPTDVIERVKKAAETAGKFLRRVWWFVIVAGMPLIYPAL